LVGQAISGHATVNHDALLHQGDPIMLGHSSALFWADVMENWQSEYLQFSLYIFATIYLIQRGSNESKTQDACATEALEIATYTAIQRLADHVGDDKTAALAASILRDEEKMIARVMREIPKLADAVVRADIRGNGSYDITTTGAADTAREAGEATKNAARTTTTAAKRTARQARKVPGVARTEGRVKGAVATEGDLAIARYDSLTADEITGKLAELSQIDLAKIDAYERKNQNRTTVLSRITSLLGDEPWAGYDELTAAEVQAVLAEGDPERAAQVRSYERSRSHKSRAGVLRVADREHSNA
jgi:Domain of unknown function (DUF892)